MFARREAEHATTVIRTSSTEYVDLWREGQLDVDFVVSSELETAHAISRILGVPAARQTDVFADGQVQLGEFDVDEDASATVLGMPLRDAPMPPDSKIAAIIRGDETILPGGDDDISVGDRIVVIGSPGAVKAWSALLWPEGGAVRDVVIFGAGRVGSAIARVLLSQGLSVRMIEASREQALRAAEALPEGARVQRDRLRPDFLERERIGQAQAGIFAMRDDAKNQYAASIAQVHGIPVHDRDRARGGVGERLRPRRDRRVDQPARGHGRGDRPLRARSADAAGRDARGKPVRGARRDHARLEPLHRHGVPRHARPRLDHRRDRAQRRRDLPARRRRPPGRRPRHHLHRGANAPWVVEAL